MALSALLILAVLGQDTADEAKLRCGSHCLYISLKALDLPVASFGDVEKALGPPGAEGYALAQLDAVAREFGAQTLGVVTSFENLQRRPGRFACIAHIDENHFVNVAAIEAGTALIFDPPRSYSIPLDTLRTRWDGTALLISDAPLLREEDLPRRFPVWILAAVVAGGTFGALGMWRFRRVKRPA